MNEPLPSNVHTGPVRIFGLTLEEFQMIDRWANMMASATHAVPDHCRGKPGNCFAICNRALRWGMDPFALAPKTHVINNTIGYEAQPISAAINTSGLLKDRLHFEWFGEWEKVIGRFETKTSRSKTNEYGEAQTYRVPAWTPADEIGLGVKVWATIKGEDEPRVLSVLLTQARVRNSTMWADDPKQQIGYLAEKKWGRLYTPEVLLGVYSIDELTEGAERDMGQADEVRPLVEADQSAPATQMERLKQDMRRALPPPKIDDVLMAITQAPDLATLEATAAPLAARLVDKDEKQRARKAYGARQKTFAQTDGTAPQNAPSEPQQTLLQPIDQAGELPLMTFAEVAAAMESAAHRKDVDALGAAATMIGQVESEQHREELRTMFNDLTSKLEAPGATS